MRDSFSTYHPAVNLLYFGEVLLFTMCLMHPISLGISLGAAIAYSLTLGGGRSMTVPLRAMLPMALMAALINPAFNHEGRTILAYFPSGNPLTLESILYGLAAGAMLVAVITWFSCYTRVMTSDKFVYLFGRIIPSLSLVLSMTLRFVPRFRAQYRIISEAQQSMGRSLSEGSPARRIKAAVSVLSILLTWSLENAIHTVDSMKSRGYGLPGRTAYSIYRLDARDKKALVWLIFCGCYLLCGWSCGGFRWRFYPTIKGAALTAFPISFQLIYLALCLTPVILARKEERTWKRLRSEI